MKTLRCPVCRKEVPITSENVPFCSDRCRLIDLGMWASEEYRIPLESAPPAASSAGNEDE